MKNPIFPVNIGDQTFYRNSEHSQRKGIQAKTLNDKIDSTVIVIDSL